MDGKDWFADQYEKVIGKPLPRQELKTDDVLNRLKNSAKYRWISEAKSYKIPEPLTGTVHYLEWSDPLIKTCTCPDQECGCVGGVLTAKHKIPRGERYFKSSLGQKLAQRFKKPVPPPSQNFMQRLAAVVGVEASVYKDLERNGILSIRGAEFCTSRCVRYYGAGNFPSYKYLQDKQKLLKKKIEFPSKGNLQNVDEDCWKCDDYTCTVSTQITLGPQGEIIIGSYSHILFGTLVESVMKDIEGTELRISSYKCINDVSQNATDSLCSLDKLLSWRELINLRELKNHLSLLKRNIYSSIFEIKETTVPENNTTTQCAKKYACKISSEKISIATPYKGVIIKAKKGPDESYTNNQALLEIHKGQNKLSQYTDLKEKSSEPVQDINDNNSLHKGTTPQQNEIEAVESKMIFGSCLNQRQESLIKSGKGSDKLVIDLATSEVKYPSKELEIHGHMSSIIGDSKLDLQVEEVKIVESIKGSVDENNASGSNHESNPINSNYELKVSNLSELAVKNLNNLDVVKQQLSKNTLSDTRKNVESSGNNITTLLKEIKTVTSGNERFSKRNTGNFFKKRLYRLSLEHLQIIQIKKFAKSLSYALGGGKIENSVQSKTNTNKNVVELNVEQNKEPLHCNSKTKSNDNAYSEFIRNKISSNNKFNTNKSLPEFVTVTDGETRSYQNLLLTTTISRIPKKIEQNDTNFLSIHEKCAPDAKSAESINEIVISCDETIPVDEKCRPHNDSQENRSKIEDERKIEYQSELRNNSIVECTGTELGNIKELDEITLHINQRNTNKNFSEKSLAATNKFSNEESMKGPSINKKLSNVSLQLKELLWKKLYNSVKSLPEGILSKCFQNRNSAQLNLGDTGLKKYVKSEKIENNEESKSSEKEVFSVKYSGQ